MATDVISDMDRNFLSDNMLECDEWAYSCTKMDDLPHFVDIETHLSRDAIFPGDLEIGLLESDRTDETWKEMSDGSDSGIDALSMKPEPLSPSSFFSDTSSEFGVSSNAAETDSVFPNSAEMTQDEWDSIQSMLPDDLDSIKDELLTDIDLDSVDADLSSFPDSSVDLSTIDSSFAFDEYGACASDILTAQTVANIIAVPVTVRPATKCSVARPMAVGVVPKTKVVIGANGKIPLQVVKHMLNAKVKIQPKPLNNSSVALHADNIMPGNPTAQPPNINKRPVAVASAAGSPLVAATQPITAPQHLTKLVPAPVIAAPLSSTRTSLVDVRAVKRQQRMIKNRESACLSRKRKKDYMQSLEEQLQAFNRDNDKLRLENTTLKRKVALLQSENERLKRSFPVSKTTGIVLLCVVFLISVNYLPSVPSLTSKSVDISASNPSSEPVSTHHTGRTLLSLQPDTALPAGEVSVDEHRQMSVTVSATGKDITAGARDTMWQEVHNLVFGRHIDGSILGGRYVCPTFFNSTESLRLVNELRGWVMGHEEELRRQQQQQQQLDQQAKQASKPRKKYYPPRKLKAAMRGAVAQATELISKYEVQLFRGSDMQYDNFLDAINRRNDTFYVVSFRHDHLLLPATAHNKTMRPRMSVMMPAVGLNETMQPPYGSIAMMQVDCEVTATRLIHIDKSTVPHHLLNNSGSTYRHQQHSGWPTHVGGGGGL